MAPKSVEDERHQRQTPRDLKRHIENEEEDSLPPTHLQHVHPLFPSIPSTLPPPSLLPGPKWDKSASIKKWQEKTSPNVQPGEVGILGRLYQSSLDIFSSLIRTSRKDPELSKHKQEVFEHQFQLFRLWGNDFDAHKGGLDRHLLYSRDLQQNILSLLISTSEILSQRLIRYMLPSADARRSVWETTDIATLLEEARCSNSENTEFDDEANRSDESEADFPTDSIDEVLEDLKVGIRCLIDLIPSILWPAEDPEHGEKVPLISFLKERIAHQYYVDLISERFPKADTNLIERLGQANWARFKRGQAEREANVEMETIDINLSGSVYSPSKFHDSGLGSSLPARTTYAQSVVSSHADGSRSRIPPLSEDAKKGEPFPCDACGRSIRVKSNREWRKHLYQDLKPYTCFYQGCQWENTAFTTRETWAEHLVLDHDLISANKDMQCPLCLEALIQDRETVSGHLAIHMEEISLRALPRGVDSEVGSLSSTSLPPDRNDDYCTACSGSGFLICCNSCSRSFHFTCCDPPLDKDVDFDVFNCHVCLARMAPLDQPPPRSGEKELGASRKPMTVIVHDGGGQTYDTTTSSHAGTCGEKGLGVSRKPMTVIVHDGGGRTYDTTSSSHAGMRGYYT